MKDRGTGRPRGFGFVVFANPEVADQVASEHHTIDGRQVEAKKAVPRDGSPLGEADKAMPAESAPDGVRTKKIFVGGLSPSVTEEVFRLYFEQFGPIVDGVVMYDHASGRPRGFGFVTYEMEESVDRVLALGSMQDFGDKKVRPRASGAARDPLTPGFRKLCACRLQWHFCLHVLTPSTCAHLRPAGGDQACGAQGADAPAPPPHYVSREHVRRHAWRPYLDPPGAQPPQLRRVPHGCACPLGLRPGGHAPRAHGRLPRRAHLQPAPVQPELRRVRSPLLGRLPHSGTSADV
mmetsp:Transcript_55000/g.174894  ORF Transcript_55000/g.174894 Transcript_55000/m.174894 type:complete len:292 (-) Transcript_55000:269-1144(-)